MSIIQLHKTEPNPTIVQDLEDMLELARSGSLKAAIIYADLGDETETRVAGNFNINTLIAVAERFKREAFIMLDRDEDNQTRHT